MKVINKRKETQYQFEGWLHDKQIKLENKTVEASEKELSDEQQQLMDRAVEAAKHRKLKEMRTRGISK